MNYPTSLYHAYSMHYLCRYTYIKYTKTGKTLKKKIKGVFLGKQITQIYWKIISMVNLMKKS